MPESSRNFMGGTACAALTATLSLLMGSTPLLAAQSCVSPPASRENIVAAANELFEALRTDDVDRFRKVTGPDFYAFDAGRRFNGIELIQFIQEAHAKGTRFSWSMNEPAVHVSCGTAWITYVNKGGIETQEGRQDLTWLESMVLEYRQSDWHIAFLQSMRAAK
jgi:ketosteroid isomerase-like protein